MPGFDGTGPMGMGPMTGGGMGFCAVPLRPAWPAYAGMGTQITYPCVASWGLPYHVASPYSPEITLEEELSYLKSLAQSIMGDLKEIEAMIQQTKNKKGER